MNLILKTVHLGSSPEASLEDRISIQLSNKLNLALIFIVAIPCIIVILTLGSGKQASLIRYELLIAFSILNLYLNKKGYYLTVKILTLTLPVLCIVISPFIFHYLPIPMSMLLWMPYAIMILGSFAFSLFSYDSQRTLMISFVVCFAVLSGMCDIILVGISNRPIDLSFLEPYYLGYKVAHNVMCIVLYYNLFFLKRINYLTQKQLDDKNDQLKNMNELLEAKVAQRTEKLVKKNIKMQELAYTNSHKVRGSVARIEGLAKILKMHGDTENDFCIEKILENVSDLNSITKDLSNKLYDEENN